MPSLLIFPRVPRYGNPKGGCLQWTGLAKIRGKAWRVAGMGWFHGCENWGRPGVMLWLVRGSSLELAKW